MQDTDKLVQVAVFCGSCSCGCPTVYVDSDAGQERRVVITDDFGQRIEMSGEQFADMIAQARSGALDAGAAAALG